MPVSISQKKGSKEEKEKAAFAVDKDLTTGVVLEGWLRLEFDRVYLIDTIIVYQLFYTDWFEPKDLCMMTVDMYRECLDSKSDVDIAVYKRNSIGKEEEGCGTLEVTYGLKQEEQIYSFWCGKEGDTVVLTKGDGAISFYEIVVTTEQVKLPIFEAF